MSNSTISHAGESSCYVNLPGSAVRTSRVGFGTSMLMSRVGGKQSLRLLATALDAGITHFDTARLYGYGEAERALGKILPGRRDKITITTKVGILPPRRSPFLSLAKALARQAIAIHPPLRGRFRRRAGSLIHAGAFDLEAVAASFETSLRQLGTDYVDFLLLHECSETDLAKPELLNFLEHAKQAGKIRAFGLATSAPVIESALKDFPAFIQVLQFRSGIFEPNLLRLRPQLPPETTVFTHSSLSSGFAQLLQNLKADPALQAAWSQHLGLDCSDRRVLGKLFLQYALRDNPDGVVLVSSADEENIRANAATLAAPYSAEQLGIFAELVRVFLTSYASHATT